ncbi:MAG: hypothetical protein ICV66_01815 [Chitinophagaceae bacterium]|nr:hypothetical protein [Chitinophagaceae bacterium]
MHLLYTFSCQSYKLHRTYKKGNAPSTVGNLSRFGIIAPALMEGSSSRKLSGYSPTVIAQAKAYTDQDVHPRGNILSAKPCKRILKLHPCKSMSYENQLKYLILIRNDYNLMRY